jgi:hypothetical protein
VTRLAIIIVNFRTPDLTMDCVRSLYGDLDAGPGIAVHVVENGSDDDSERRLRAAIEADGREDRVNLVVSARNTGFAGGNNLGIAAAGEAEYYLLLNSDTIVHDGCLPYCLRLLSGDPRIGVMSARLDNVDGTPQVVARRFSPPHRQLFCALGLPWRLPRIFGWADPEDDWDRRTVKRDVDWVGGAFMLIRRDVIRTVGSLDDDFFFYGEDCEFCFRVRRAGFRIHYDPAVSITHLGGGSSDPAKLARDQHAMHAWRGRYLVYAKCYGRGAAFALRVVDLLNYGLQTLCYRLSAGRDDERYVTTSRVFSLLACERP